EALHLIEECVHAAQLSRDAHLQHFCHLTASYTLTRVGYLPAAKDEIDIAGSFATSDEQTYVDYQAGLIAQEDSDHPSAVMKFKQALQAGWRSRDPAWKINTELNIAYSL